MRVDGIRLCYRYLPLSFKRDSLIICACLTYCRSPLLNIHVLANSFISTCTDLDEFASVRAWPCLCVVFLYSRFTFDNESLKISFIFNQQRVNSDRHGLLGWWMSAVVVCTRYAEGHFFGAPHSQSTWSCFSPPTHCGANIVRYDFFRHTWSIKPPEFYIFIIYVDQKASVLQLWKAGTECWRKERVRNPIPCLPPLEYVQWWSLENDYCYKMCNKPTAYINGLACMMDTCLCIEAGQKLQ